MSAFWTLAFLIDVLWYLTVLICISLKIYGMKSLFFSVIMVRSLAHFSVRLFSRCCSKGIFFVCIFVDCIFVNFISQPLARHDFCRDFLSHLWSILSFSQVSFTKQKMLTIPGLLIISLTLWAFSVGSKMSSRFSILSFSFMFQDGMFLLRFLLRISLCEWVSAWLL